MAAPVATSPTMLVQPPTATWRPSAPAHTSACAPGAITTGAIASTVAVHITAINFVISYPFCQRAWPPFDDPSHRAGCREASTIRPAPAVPDLIAIPHNSATDRSPRELATVRIVLGR